MNFARRIKCSHARIFTLMEYVLILLKWHWDSCSKSALFGVSNVTKFDEGFSSCTTTSFTTPSEFLIDFSASVRLTVDGCAIILSSFPISHVGVEFMPIPRSHQASFMDSFPIELKLPDKDLQFHMINLQTFSSDCNK